MGILNRFLGFKWSLYLIKNSNDLHLALHANHPLILLGFVMNRFSDRGEIAAPWGLYINHNVTNKLLQLHSKHFTSCGRGVTEQLKTQLASIDRNWTLGESTPPILVDPGTKNELDISILFKALDIIFKKTDTPVDNIETGHQNVSSNRQPCDDPTTSSKSTLNTENRHCFLVESGSFSMKITDTMLAKILLTAKGNNWLGAQELFSLNRDNMQVVSLQSAFIITTSDAAALGHLFKSAVEKTTFARREVVIQEKFIELCGSGGPISISLILN